MHCDEFERVLEQELTEPHAAAAAAHLETCQACCSLAAELSAIRMAGHNLGEQDAEGLEAPERVWIGLRSRLEEAGLIREPLVGGGERVSWWSFLQRPVLAGVVLSLVAVAGVLSGYQKTIAPAIVAQSRIEIPVVPPEPADVSEELQNALNDTVSGSPAAHAIVADSIRRDLAIIDSSIALCEKSVREQPQNEIAREYLYGAYEEKAELVDLAAYRTVTGGLQ